MDYLICKEFGWTLNYVHFLPQVKYEELIAIMSIEKQFQRRGVKEVENLPKISKKYSKKII